MEHKDIIDKIRKLLSLSRSSNVHEAAAATAKVMELLAKYNLKMESVTPEDNKPSAVKVHRKTRQKLENWAFALADSVSSVFDCYYYHKSRTGETVFVGIGANPEVCGWMYGYLYRMLLRLASAYLRADCRHLRSNASKKTARNSFLMGAVNTIYSRLKRHKKETPVTSDALVPFSKDIIAAAMPEITSRPTPTGKIRMDSWGAGVTAGAAVSLYTPIKNAASQQLALGT
jgi:hypothetical protein